MAFRLARRPHSGSRSGLRTAGVATVLISAAVTVPTVASAAPAGNGPIAPKIQSVQQRLGALALKNDQLVEKYNQANVKYHATQKAAAVARAAFRAAQHKLVLAEDQLAQSAAAQYEGGTFSATGALLSSDSGTSYLDQLTTLSMLSQHNAQVVSSFTEMQRQAAAAKTKADNLFTAARQTRAEVERQRAATASQIDKYKKVLSSLNAQQQAMWAARSGGQVSPSAVSVHATSAAAEAAVKFALAQVGKPYVFGASGPDSYDCSGLTMAAWQQGGVSLPHSAADQYNYGHHVSIDSLQPGDLIFMYQPIEHVTIYIGDGMMVSAPTEGENVQVVSVQSFANDIVGATRLVG